MAQPMTPAVPRRIPHPSRLIARRFAWILVPLLGLLTLAGCSNHPPIVNGFMPVEIGGRVFELEVVSDDQSRTLGLGGRTQLAPDHGMLFSFPESQLRHFVMRDCHIDIDIIFLDATGRIVAMHAMTVEPDRQPDESLYQYETRLKKYSSRYNARYAIELLGGTLATLDLSDGQLIEFDREYLKTITK